MKIFNTKNFAAIGVAFCFIVIGLGAWTRLADAGLGCPDWPGCYGFVTFPTTPDEIAIAETLYPDSPVEIDKIIPEVVHRYFAAALGLLAIALVSIAFKEQKMKTESLALLLIIIGQGIFGYLTVSLKLLPIIVTLHLFGGFTTLTLFYFIYLKSRNFEIFNQINISNLKTIAGVAFLALIFQIILGVLTILNGAQMFLASMHQIGSIVLISTSVYLLFLNNRKLTNSF